VRTGRFVAGALAAATTMLGCHTAIGADVMIRDATVHTMTSAGVIKGGDLLILDGRIESVGADLQPPPGVEVVEAHGKPLTPGFFGGLTQLGLREISYEPASEDDAWASSSMRPEFDVSLAFNPASAAVEVSATEGYTFAQLAPVTGGSVVAGRGALAFLNGGLPSGPLALFINFGGDADSVAGGSRAGQHMLVSQALDEASTRTKPLIGDERLLTPRGRAILQAYARKRGLVVFDVDRASDILRVLRLAEESGLHAAIAGGTEAWRVAPELAAARIPVILDPLANIPTDFDSLGATLENAARLHRAGVEIAFSFYRDEPIRMPRLRQAAGNAVANGLPWDAALEAMTLTPARIFGAEKLAGSLKPGKVADLVLWSGDPLELDTFAELVHCGGRSLPMVSRETLLRDRYRPKRSL
jgi:imidazolonepropionase-like amidohydrolase